MTIPVRPRPTLHLADHDPSADIVFSPAKTPAAGYHFNEIIVPFDAKVVGDSTGLTPPF